MERPKIISEIEAQAKSLFDSLSGWGESVSAPLRAKLLLMINHVLSQEPEAVKRLKLHSNKVVALDGPLGEWMLRITPAGLLEEFGEAQQIDLRVTVKKQAPTELMQTLLKGGRPAVNIEGAADLAALFAWLGENVRWDYAEDLSRIIGDVPTQVVADQLQLALKGFKGMLDAIAQYLKR